MPLEGYADPVKSLGAKIVHGNPVLLQTAVGKHPRHGPIGIELREEHVAEERVASCERMAPWCALHIAAGAEHLVGPGPAGPLARHQHAVLHAQLAHHFRGHERRCGFTGEQGDVGAGADPCTNEPSEPSEPSDAKPS